MLKTYFKLYFSLFIIVICINTGIYSQTGTYPPHIAYDIKVERIKFTNDAVKLTWKMNPDYQGEFIIGRSEKEILSVEDSLQANLAGVFNPGQAGIFIDTEMQPGKKYYYIVLAKDFLFKRDISIIKNVNYTPEGISLYTGPESVQSIRADISDENTILLQWSKVKGDGIKYNIYRSKNPISSKAELEVSDKIATVEKTDNYIDKNILDYGSYFYAITITDKNGIEYFTPIMDKNYTSNGIYLKGKSLSTPLNVGAYIADKNSIIIKWIKAESRTGKDIMGYEIYRSDEIINSLFKLKFSRLLQIADNKTFIYTDKNLPGGKYFYAVFPRYTDGTVDINFDNDSNYTKNPLLITQPFELTGIKYESLNNKIVILWNYSGNTGDETVSLFKSLKIPLNSDSVRDDEIFGTENIKSGKYILANPPAGCFYYGIMLKNDKKITKFSKGRNITADPVNFYSGTKVIQKEKNPVTDSDNNINSLDYILSSTYYKGEYSLALKELKKFIKSTDDNHERTKAKLFIAKTYIEQNDFEKGIRILDSDDVKKLFPEETKFWFEFAIRRLK